MGCPDTDTRDATSKAADAVIHPPVQVSSMRFPDVIARFVSTGDLRHAIKPTKEFDMSFDDIRVELLRLKADNVQLQSDERENRAAASLVKVTIGDRSVPWSPEDFWKCCPICPMARAPQELRPP